MEQTFNLSKRKKKRILVDGALTLKLEGLGYAILGNFV